MFRLIHKPVFYFFELVSNLLQPLDFHILEVELR